MPNAARVGPQWPQQTVLAGREATGGMIKATFLNYHLYCEEGLRSLLRRADLPFVMIELLHDLIYQNSRNPGSTAYVHMCIYIYVYDTCR